MTGGCGLTLRHSCSLLARVPLVITCRRGKGLGRGRKHGPRGPSQGGRSQQILRTDHLLLPKETGEIGRKAANHGLGSEGHTPPHPGSGSVFFCWFSEQEVVRVCNKPFCLPGWLIRLGAERNQAPPKCPQATLAFPTPGVAIVLSGNSHPAGRLGTPEALGHEMD